MSESPREAAEAQARNRFIVMNAVRVSGIALVLVGLAIARYAAPMSPEWIFGAALAVMGLLEFFFLPRMIVRRWKAGDQPPR